MISIDLSSMIFGLLLPFWIALSIFIALALGKRFETYIIGSYVKDTVNRNNELIIENQKLRDELKKKVMCK
jgi:hypothetical protein